MKIFVFGNLDLSEDSLPLRLVPKLEKLFPRHHFVIKDPNEEWDMPEEFFVIDTVQGIDKVAVFDDLDKFEKAPRTTMHDFDALTNLRYLKKLGKIKKIKIIGLPPMMDEKTAPGKIYEYLV